MVGNDKARCVRLQRTGEIRRGVCGNGCERALKEGRPRARARGGAGDGEARAGQTVGVTTVVGASQETTRYRALLRGFIEPSSLRFLWLTMTTPPQISKSLSFH